jgi:sulfite dehydrogenase
LTIQGKVETPLSMSVAELKTNFEPVELTAVNQCAGNSRGLFAPRIAGGQIANGAMATRDGKACR